MKRLVFIVFSLSVIVGFAQNEVLELPIGYKSTFYNGKESLAISNEKTGELVLFVEDYGNTKAILLNSKFEVLSQIETESLPNSFKTFIGHQINADGSYSIYFTNNSNKKYGILNLDFQAKNAEMHTLEFKLKKEVYVESISFKGDFYLMSVTKNGSDIHFYNFNENGVNTDKHTVNFNFLDSKSANGFPKRAYNYLVTKGIGSSGSLVKMDNDIPNAIEITSKPNKLYIKDGQFVFTFDNDNSKTIVATVSPTNYEMNIDKFEQLKSDNAYFQNYNSYIYDDKLFQIISSPDEMKFSIRDIESKELLKSIVLKKEDTITFKNTPIIQEGPGFIAGTRTREMEETSKFLRKISRGDVGISAYKQNTNYKITIGSKIEIKSGGGMMMPMGGFGGMPMGTVGSLSVSFNPTFFAYSGYSSTKSTHIDCLFNDKFEHLEGEISENVFDKIKTFEDGFTKNTSNEPQLKNVFRHNGKLYFGFVASQDKNYHLIEFSE